MSYVDPTIVDFKAYFTRDFVYGITPNTVQDPDIQKGLDQASFVINQGLFGTQLQYSTAFELLAAHYMVLDLQESSQGVSGGFDWLISSKGVGSVSEGLTIPQRIIDNAEYAYLTKTAYGAKYLMMVLPLLSGAVFTVDGRTNA